MGRNTIDFTIFQFQARHLKTWRKWKLPRIFGKSPTSTFSITDHRMFLESNFASTNVGNLVWFVTIGLFSLLLKKLFVHISVQISAYNYSYDRRRSSNLAPTFSIRLTYQGNSFSALDSFGRMISKTYLKPVKWSYSKLSVTSAKR